MSTMKDSSINQSSEVEEHTMNSDLKSTLDCLQTHFTRDAWESHDSVKTVYEEFLFQTEPSHISEHLEKVLPPALMLADHHDLDNRVLGVKCLNHIAGNVTRAELSWFGRAEVIYDCLQRVMYTHEAPLIEILHPCLIKVLAAIDSNPTKHIEKQSRYDMIFGRLLTDMEMEDKLAVRLAYSKVLVQYIHVLGLTLLKHMKGFLQMTFSYLEVYDGPHENTRLNILKSLQLAIWACWPRIPAHSERIIQALLRLVYDIAVDQTQTPKNVKQEVIKCATDSLVLITRASSEKSLPLLHALRSLELHDSCDKCLDEVMSTA